MRQLLCHHRFKQWTVLQLQTISLVKVQVDTEYGTRNPYITLVSCCCEQKDISGMASRVDARTRELQAPSTALVTQHAEDPKADIIAERKRASFDVNELLYWLNGGRDKVERR